MAEEGLGMQNKKEKKIEQDEETKRVLLSDHFEPEVMKMRSSFNQMMREGLIILELNRIEWIKDDTLVAFLTHIRILYSFFYRFKKDEREACAWHYNPNWEVKFPLEDHEGWYNQINKYLSHLDYARVTGKIREYKRYPIDLFYTYFRSLIIDFLTRLDEKWKTPAIINLLKTLEQEISNQMSNTDDKILAEINKAIDRLAKKYPSLSFKIRIGDGQGAKNEGDDIVIGRGNPLELIEIITLHEAYHKIMGVNQVENGDFSELDKGNYLPYLRTKISIFMKIYEDFPELKDIANQSMRYILPK